MLPVNFNAYCTLGPDNLEMIQTNAAGSAYRSISECKIFFRQVGNDQNKAMYRKTFYLSSIEVIANQASTSKFEYRYVVRIQDEA